MQDRARAFWEQALSEIDDQGYFAVLERRRRRLAGAGGRVEYPAGTRASGGASIAEVDAAHAAEAWQAERMVTPGSLRLSDIWLILLALSPLWLFGLAVFVLIHVG
jgi:hypothetical protein